MQRHVVTSDQKHSAKMQHGWRGLLQSRSLSNLFSEMAEISFMQDLLFFSFLFLSFLSRL